MKYNFEIIAVKTKGVDTERLKRLVRRIYSHEGIAKEIGLNIILTGNEKLRGLNKKFKDSDRATDVLSFAFDEDKTPGNTMLGEVYISLEKAATQSKKYDVSVQNEVERLLVHGILHLLGFSHQNSDDAKEMFSKTESYLSYHKGKEK